MELLCQDGNSNCTTSLLIMLWNLSPNLERYLMVQLLQIERQNALLQNMAKRVQISATSYNLFLYLEIDVWISFPAMQFCSN